MSSTGPQGAQSTPCPYLHGGERRGLRRHRDRHIDIASGESFGEGFKRKNPIGGVPMLGLDDSSCISESVAISRHYEAL